MPTLKQGSKGPKVIELQTKLKELGFDPGAIDGAFGPGTKTALIAFQKSKGLKSDGVAGPFTLAALQLGDNAAGDVPPGTSATDTGFTTPNTETLNLDGLSGHLPDWVIEQIPETALKFDITTNLRLAHFLAQCALESAQFKATVENLNYSAKRLREIFPKYFKNVDPSAYAHNPEKIGNRVYASRMGNGDEASGDGFKFRGRGYIQLTGRNNYTSFTNFIGEDCLTKPDLVATSYPLASAGFFFNSNDIWPVCDKGASDATVRAVSTRVNGKNPHAVPQRIKFFREFNQALK